jgi:two-component system, NarL family, sensor kinase
LPVVNFLLSRVIIAARLYLLPNRWFARLAVAAGLLIALLLVVDLEFVRNAATSLLASNSLDFAIVCLAAICAFFAARRAAGYARQLWLLLAIALTLESAAQAITTYYQSFVPNAAGSPWPSDILFFVWAAPVFMVFLPRSDDQHANIDSLRLLDFLQIAILAVTLYVYFFYSPLRWKANSETILRQILFLFIARDLLLTVAFAFRSRGTFPAWLKRFSVVLAIVFLTVTFTDVDYLVLLGTDVGAASWGDFFYVIPYLILIIYAVKWKAPEAAPASSPATSAFGSMIATQVLPIGIPLLVILMGRAIAREQLLFAWIAMAASVLCSSIRLILTNRRQRYIADNLLSTERALRSSEEILSTAFRNSPDAFSINPFPNGPYLEINEGYSRLTGYSREDVLGKTPRQMNLWVDSEHRDTVLATLRDSGFIRDFEFRFRTKGEQIRIGQMSASVVEIRGQRCSLVIVRDITARKEAEEILRSSEEQFRSLVRDLYFAVVLYTPDAKIEFANHAAYRMFGIPEGAAIGKHPNDLGIFAVTEDGKPLSYADHPVPYVLRTRVPIRDGLMAFRRAESQNILWIFGSVVPQVDANGNIVRVITSFANVTEMKNAERAIHNLSTQLLKLQDEERRRIGRELHDGLAQTVLAINLSLAQVRQSLKAEDTPATRSLEKARALTQQMSREIRTLSYLLHPPLLDDLGLVSTLKEYAHGFSERSGIETKLFADTNFHRLPQPLEIALFRIVQESLANIQRHSGSASAEIRISQHNLRLTLEVIDHGHGMLMPSNGSGDRLSGDTNSASLEAKEGDDSPAPLRKASTWTLGPDGTRLGVGIPGMRERMSQLGGHLDIISGPTGTTVRATISLTSATETSDASSSHLDRG